MGSYTTILLLSSLLCFCTGQLDDLLIDEIMPQHQQSPALKCGYKITFPNASDTKYAIEENYLMNKKVLYCDGAVSEELRNMFKSSKASSQIRENLRNTLGNVCSAFVSVISAVAFHSKAFKGRICNDGIFSQQSLNADFCDKVSKLDNEAKTAVSSNIEAFGPRFKSAATEVVMLGNLYESTCVEKCGSGPSKILCNAYYSLATVFSQEYSTVLGGNANQSKGSHGEITATTTGDQPDPTTIPSPGSTPSSSPAQENKPFIQLSIAQYLPSILSLSKKDHSILMSSQNDPTYRETFISERLPELSDREASRMANLPDFMRLLRMAWVVRVVGNELRTRSDSDFVFYAENNDNVLHSMPVSAQEDLRELGSSLGAAMRDVHVYREDLFSQPPDKPDTTVSIEEVLDEPTEPPAPELGPTEPVATEPPPTQPPEPPQPPAVKPQTPQPMDSEPAPAVPSDLDPQQYPFYEDDDLPPLWGGLDSVITTPLQSPPVSPFVNLKQNATFLEVMMIVDSGTDPPVVNPLVTRMVQYLINLLHVKDKAELFTKLRDPVFRKENGIDDIVPKSSVEDEDEDEEEPRSRYGAFHFLGLFLFVGGVVVVAYLCMHNRKKIREGVGNYMTSDSKRRRARKYKPLATSEA